MSEISGQEKLERLDTLQSLAKEFQQEQKVKGKENRQNYWKVIRQIPTEDQFSRMIQLVYNQDSPYFPSPKELNTLCRQSNLYNDPTPERDEPLDLPKTQVNWRMAMARLWGERFNRKVYPYQAENRSHYEQALVNEQKFRQKVNTVCEQYNQSAEFSDREMSEPYLREHWWQDPEQSTPNPE